MDSIDIISLINDMSHDKIRLKQLIHGRGDGNDEETHHVRKDLG